jgi:hypothetical protein
VGQVITDKKSCTQLQILLRDVTYRKRTALYDCYSYPGFMIRDFGFRIRLGINILLVLLLQFCGISNIYKAAEDDYLQFTVSCFSIQLIGRLRLGPDGIRAEISEIPRNDFENPRKFRVNSVHAFFSLLKTRYN